MTDEAGPLRFAEAAWERSREAPRVDAAFLRDRLRRWPHLLDRPWSVLGGGLRSLNVRLGEDLVARLSLAAGHDLRKEAAILRRMEGRVRVPRVVDGDGSALLLEYVPHAGLPGSEEAGLRTGRALARIQGERFPRPGLLDADLRVPEPFPSALEGLRQWAGECLAGGAGERLGGRAPAVRALWEREEARLDGACGDVVLVHSDFKPANVKWLPAERDVLVLDWEFAWAGPPLLDVGMLLRWGAPAGFVAGFERGYGEEGGSLPPGWRRTAELLDLFNLVGLLALDVPGAVRERDLLLRVDETLRA